MESPRGDVVGIQVRARRTVLPQDLEGLELLRELAGERFRRGIVLHLGNEAAPMVRDVWSVPIGALWKQNPSN
jgi:hypothetical protein